MKYYKVIFKVVSADGTATVDDITMQTTRDLLCALTAETGFESFEECPTGVCGYVQQEAFNAEALGETVSTIPISGVNITYEVSEAEDKDWNQAWEDEGFEPIIINERCVIHDRLHPTPPSADGMIDITIDAKQAFGTGTHDTTQMIVAELVTMNLHGLSVLDCGCGTGILSIAAAKAGAKSVTAYDIDEWSVRNTLHNCDINNVDNVTALEGNANIIATLNKKYDAVLANINRNILLADMPKFKQAMAEQSVLILSGFYTEDSKLLMDKAETLGLKFKKSTESNNWYMLVFSN